MSLRSLRKAHRADLAELTGLAQRDLALMFREFNKADTARDGLLDALPRLVAVYGAAAATLGADWYEEMRDEAGVGGSFSAIAAELPDDGRMDALARWGVGPLYQAEPDWKSALVLVAGGLQRIIANADRESVTRSSVADRHARGWVRVWSGGCGWCEGLADGTVHSAASAAFKAHDHCGCYAAPDFG